MLLYEFETLNDWAEFGDTIKRDCQPYLQQVSDPYKLYRGMKSQDWKNGAWGKKEGRLEGRLPRGLGFVLTKVANDFFEENFGGPFRNSVLATGNHDAATVFGTVHNIFPIGEFEFVWSPRVDDINYHLNDYLFKLPDYTWEEEMYQFLERSQYTNKNLDAAIKSGNEIMIRCKEYYAIEMQHLQTDAGKQFMRHFKL